jgi:hypothetical protein
MEKSRIRDRHPGSATLMPRGQFKNRYWFFADTPNIGRNYCVIWKDLWWRADSYSLLKYREGNTLWKVCRSPTLCCYLQTIIECKWHKQAPLSSFRPTKGWVLHWFLWKSQQHQLIGRPIECYHFQPNSFLIGRNLLDWNLVEGKKRHLLHVW